MLATAGYRVGIFEALEGFDDSPRTYIVTPRIRQFIANFPADLVLNEINTMALETASGKVVNLRLKEPDLVIERSQLLQFMANRAKAAGAEIQFGFRFSGTEFVGDTHATTLVRKKSQQVSIESKWLIGADGVRSRVAKSVGFREQETVPLLQTDVELPRDWDSSLSKVWFNVHETPYFFWLIPESETRGVVGLIGEHKTNLRLILDRFLEKHNFRAGNYQGGNAALFNPTFAPWKTKNMQETVLVGDAAGHVKVSTVGGSVTGFWGAKAAANSVLSTATYSKELRSLNKELRIHWFLRLILNKFENEDYDLLLKMLNRPLLGYLEENNRDQIAVGAWKLPFLQPRLFVLGLRMIKGVIRQANVFGFVGKTRKDP